MMREPITVEKPWGSFRQFALNEPCTVKIITIKPGEALSLQRHEGRSEFWRVLLGDPLITIEETTTPAKPGDEFYVPKEVSHRITGQGTECQVLEVSFGFFDEADIERLEDNYGRV
jgi:mannose-6-phosphate isomerase